MIDHAPSELRNLSSSRQEKASPTLQHEMNRIVSNFQPSLANHVGTVGRSQHRLLKLGSLAFTMRGKAHHTVSIRIKRLRTMPIELTKEETNSVRALLFFFFFFSPDLAPSFLSAASPDRNSIYISV